MINLLLISSYETIDFARYLDTIEFNVALYSRVKGHSKIISKNLPFMMEKGNQNRLWHSFNDWWLSLTVYLTMSKALKLKINYKALLYCAIRLRSIAKKYPRFADTGFQGHAFLKDFQGGS